jgi:rubrerythrin
MTGKDLVARVRQIAAFERNAGDLYRDLSKTFSDERLRSVFDTIAQDEARHLSLCLEVLALLEPLDS